MKRKKIAVALLLLLSVFIMSFSSAGKEREYKNLKILSKNISHDDLGAVMKNYCVSLGVKCGHCHVKNGDKFDFVSDAKTEKLTARKMQKITNTINKKFFGGNTGTVGCMTCHNGKVHPAEANVPVH